MTILIRGALIMFNLISTLRRYDQLILLGDVGKQNLDDPSFHCSAETSGDDHSDSDAGQGFESDSDTSDSDLSTGSNFEYRHKQSSSNSKRATCFSVSHFWSTA